jgi:hypothetical protein
VLTAAEEEMMPANLHVSSLSQSIPAFQDGQINFLTERTTWTPGIVGINCFGRGYVNGHCILDLIRDRTAVRKKFWDKRLVVFSSTTEHGVESMLKHIKNHSENLALHYLLNENSKLPSNGHLFRGFTILNSTRKCQEVQVNIKIMVYTTKIYMC